MVAPDPRFAQARELLRFGMVGIANTLISASLIVGLTWSGVDPFIANCVGYVAGTLFSFHANARWTFGYAATRERLAKFTAVILAAYAINVAVLAIALWAGWDKLASQVPAMVCFTVFNYIGQRRWTFRSTGGGK